nr:hypothetical protein GCM10025699_68240 [Microbacterium flavescens]
MGRRGGAALRRGQLAAGKVLAFVSALALVVGLVRILQAHVVGGIFVVIAVALMASAFALARSATRRR